MWRKNYYRWHLRFKKAWESLYFNISGGRIRIPRLWFHTSFNKAQNIYPSLLTTFFVPPLRQGARSENWSLWLLIRQKTTWQAWFLARQVTPAAHSEYKNTSLHTKQDIKDEGGSTTFSNNTVLWWSNHGLKTNKQNPIDSAHGLAHADCFRGLQDISQLQPSMLLTANMPWVLPCPMCFVSLQIWVKYTRPGFRTSGFISTMNVLLVWICKGTHLRNQIIFSSNSAKTSCYLKLLKTPPLVWCQRMLPQINKTKKKCMYIQNHLFIKTMILFIWRPGTFQQKRFLKLVNAKQTVKLLLVKSKKISYFESTLKKYLYMFLTSESSILVHLYLPWRWAISRRRWGKTKQYVSKFCNASSSSPAECFILSPASSTNLQLSFSKDENIFTNNDYFFKRCFMPSKHP